MRDGNNARLHNIAIRMCLVSSVVMDTFSRCFEQHDRTGVMSHAGQESACHSQNGILPHRAIITVR